MTKLNHARPQLKLLDNFRQEASRVMREAKEASKWSPPDFEKRWPWETMILPPRPRDDKNLAAEHVKILEDLLDLDGKRLIAQGFTSPLLGKVTQKKKVALLEAEQNLIDGAVLFLRHCAATAEKEGTMEPLKWFMDYCNAFLRLGNSTIEAMADVVFGLALERYFWTSLESDDEVDRARLIAFVKSITQ